MGAGARRIAAAPARRPRRQRTGPVNDDRNGLAEDRTDWAEDRTLLANERTFAAWMRTGLSSVAVGLGIQAIFGKAEPLWLAKATASGFIVIGIVIFVLARQASKRLVERLSAHAAEPLSGVQMDLVGALFSVVSVVLAAILWWL